jgi:hypothetical protein
MRKMVSDEDVDSDLFVAIDCYLYPGYGQRKDV